MSDSKISGTGTKSYLTSIRKTKRQNSRIFRSRKMLNPSTTTTAMMMMKKKETILETKIRTLSTTKDLSNNSLNNNNNSSSSNNKTSLTTIHNPVLTISWVKRLQSNPHIRRGLHYRLESKKNLLTMMKKNLLLNGARKLKKCRNSLHVQVL